MNWELRHTIRGVVGGVPNGVPTTLQYTAYTPLTPSRYKEEARVSTGLTRASMLPYYPASACGAEDRAFKSRRARHRRFTHREPPQRSPVFLLDAEEDAMGAIDVWEVESSTEIEAARGRSTNSCLREHGENPGDHG